jgi:CBS domain containing-hemolysin-like protein
MKYTDLITSIFKLNLKHTNLTEDELRFVINSGEEKGLIDKRESDIIKNVMRFSDKEASNIMYPVTRLYLFNMGQQSNRRWRLL